MILKENNIETFYENAHFARVKIFCYILLHFILIINIF